MANRFDSFADALTGWLAEYAQKQQVSKFGRCGESAGSELKKAASGSSELVRNTPPLLITEQRPIQVSGGQGQAKADAPLEPVQTGRAAAGIHLVPEPPAIPEETEWSDGMTSLEQYKDQGVK